MAEFKPDDTPMEEVTNNGTSSLTVLPFQRPVTLPNMFHIRQILGDLDSASRRLER